LEWPLLGKGARRLLELNVARTRAFKLRQCGNGQKPRRCTPARQLSNRDKIRILCETHNIGLSEIDAESGKLVGPFRSFEETHTELRDGAPAFDVVSVDGIDSKGVRKRRLSIKQLARLHAVGDAFLECNGRPYSWICLRQITQAG
jgi:hypothetical protein